MADTLRIVSATSQQVDRLSQEIDRLSQEMRAFKDEIRADTRAFKEEVRADTRALKEEMRAFKDEINADTRAFKAEMRAFRIEMNKRWGELSASLGLLVENIVAPSVPRVLSQVFACPDEAIEFLGLRLRRKHPVLPDRNREFDAVAVGCGYVLIVESKVQLDARAVAEFAERLPEVREYFPEFADKGYSFAGAVASLYVDPSVVAFAEKLGLIVLGTGDDLMEVLNSPGFTPRTY
jgi:outer membrane murein-binding lipoprotein Lpp